MTQIVSSISGIEIYAPSAGTAPTNSAVVSAIASAYQVVSATGTQLYAGTAHVTSINSAPISASRAGNAANASMANSAYYDGTGRLISSLPDAATVSAIASSYADGKADSSALSSYALSADVSSTINTVANNSASWGAGVSLPITGSVGTDSATYGVTSVEFNRYDTAGEPDIRTATLSPDALNIMSTVDGNDYYSVNINENGIEFGDPDGYHSVNPSDINNWNSAVETVANNSATWGGGAQVVTATGSASATAVTGGYPPIGTSYLVSSINGSALLPYGYSALSGNSAKWTSTNSAVSANSATWNSTTSAVSANSAGWTSTNSAVSANSAKWTSTNNTVLTNSANWNSVYNTVSSNSASWSGSTGGGSVTSPSGTIMVMNGNEIEGTNSAVVTASGTGFEELLSPQTQQIGTYMQTLTNGTVPGTGATLRIPLENPAWTNVRVNLSGQGENGFTSASGVIPSGALTASIPMDGITGNISASSEQWVPLNSDQLTAEKEGGIKVTGIGELAWASSVSGVVNTVSSNSATWGQGGVDSATVSSIASSYAESAISSVSGNYYSTSNPAGYITGVDLSNYATTGYVDSSVSSKADSSSLSSYALSADVSGVVSAVSSNSASWGQGGVDSATVSAIASSYAESAVSGKMDSSAIDYTRTSGGTQIYASGTGSSTNQFSAKNDSAGAAIIAGANARVRLWDSAATANIYASSVGPWNDATNLVTAQSANWGGSALALSAGPGVKLEKVGNTLVASTDETVLWSGSYQNTATGSIELSESWKHFQKIEVYGFNTEGKVPIAGIYYTSPFSGESLMEVVVGTQGFASWGTPSAFNVSVSIPCRFTSDTAVNIGSAKYVGYWNSNWLAANNLNGRTYISKIVGVNRTAGV